MATSDSMKIFKAVVDELGSSLKPSGFKYLKSKREATRQGKLFEHSVTFSSSRSINSLDGHIHLEIRATAWSEEFGEFRRSNGIDLPINEACLFGTTIENIFIEAPPYIRYDIGYENERAGIVQSIENVLNEKVLKAFDLIESPEALESFLQSNKIPALEAFNAREDYFDFIRTKIA